MISLKQLPNQERDEKAILFLRRHWIEVLRILFFACVFAVIPVIFYYILTDNGVDWNGYWGQFGALLVSIYALFALAILMTMFTDYYLDTWIVTTRRVINIEQKGLFSRVISELHLNQVQDVTAETHGFIATILSYGHVYIQTAGTRERFEFKMVNDPVKVKARVSELVENDKRIHGDASKVT
ncbi:PH domain-containing protein [Candidatus Uhrbacteria bacterium]|jgi:hypothetical protein|nr:PH domain-containing protein [Candidatus Uhrbacteria bacterium]MBT7717129.1 PH domain-containing protein [Candidatus Uhrbacteria bacterium]